ncbi:sarcoplasmic calcium-binding protein-like [Lingula anatina]|uniref:Sarcoplasmic calcium-binding protein-like n=1 Tax=Lingula anatina TaxID=7574 RepID=A0A2R2MKW4_LINAN|nr:sarcoplasmic calcium-binding protein-like [Lingula anatina]|eukprot:XP_023930849.1 sarcoplasmic calcium-binding protein-like [Lingula anatina]
MTDFILSEVALYNTNRYQPMVKRWAKGIFQAADENDDEELNVFEHKALLQEGLDKGDKRRHKLARFFNILDADNDGFVDKHDYVNRAVERARVYFGADKIKAFNDTVSKAWSSFWSIPEDDFLERLDVTDFILIDVAVYNTNRYQPMVKRWAKGIFQAADENDDEELNVFEHKDLLQVFNVHQGFDDSFSYVDENQSGGIDKKEFVKAGVDFFCNGYEDSLFFGA